ncbi:MAG: phage portal protein [Comamonadaceae bacterium]|nr:phage portal protein [Comamonadaceae bacterium]
MQRQVIETWARDGEALLVQVTGKAAGNTTVTPCACSRWSACPCNTPRPGQKAPGHHGGRGQRHIEPRGLLAQPGQDRDHAGGHHLTRVDADQVLHVFKPYRPEQVRGMPAMHACISGLKMLDGYEEAAIVAARVGASKMGFFTTPDGDASPLGDEKDEQGNTITDADL